MRRERKITDLIEEGAVLLVDALFFLLGSFKAWTGRKPVPTARPSLLDRFVPYWIRRSAWIGFGVLLIVGAAVFARYLPEPTPAQPVPFSHHLHVTTKHLNCFFCHTSPDRSSNAGIPPVEKCLLCHNVIASRFSPIAKLRGYYQRNEPVPWVRVNYLPDFVQFTHESHLARRFDCSVCHGAVSMMDRLAPAHRFDMNFCVTCHWKNKGPDSCFVCHY